jgi:ApbE superfamily uncharacterized protein (UPF0280 family)
VKRKKTVNDSIQFLSDGSVWVDYGPMRIWIRVWEGDRTLIPLAKEGAQLAISVLEDLARFLHVIKRKSLELKGKKSFPEVVQRMVEATQKMGEADLTPLAAVAGAVSDMVADFIFARGGSKIIVDNGGDIAIRLRENEVAKVGIKTEIEAPKPAYLLSIDSTMNIGGVATSGLGGRSFTKGIAQAATVVAETASLADAAATTIGNFTNIEDSNILRLPAEKIYPDTDLKGEWVTVEVGELSQEKIGEALRAGLSKADLLVQKGLIKGALVSVQGKVGWTDSMNSWLTVL